MPHNAISLLYFVTTFCLHKLVIALFLAYVEVLTSYLYNADLVLLFFCFRFSQVFLILTFSFTFAVSVSLSLIELQVNQIWTEVEKHTI